MFLELKGIVKIFRNKGVTLYYSKLRHTLNSLLSKDGKEQ